MSSERLHTSGSDSARPEPSFFRPRATLHCSGVPTFRSQAARDLGCLLDVDDAVRSWECQPFPLLAGSRRHLPDFLAVYRDGTEMLLDASDGEEDPVVTEAAARAGFPHRYVSREERESGWRLRNARDLLRYGNYGCPLGDRIRVIAALDEVGSFSVAEGLGLFREVPPMAGLASLVLQRILTIDLDQELINPDTVVRRGEL
ncbi:hypothetical protein HJA95_14305 [Rhizobium binae]|nr:hypothetical protein [Rhizobium binae]